MEGHLGTVVARRQGRRGGRGIISAIVSQDSVHSGSEVFDQMHECVGETQDATYDVPMEHFFIYSNHFIGPFETL